MHQSNSAFTPRNTPLFQNISSGENAARIDCNPQTQNTLQSHISPQEEGGLTEPKQRSKNTLIKSASARSIEFYKNTDLAGANWNGLALIGFRLHLSHPPL